MTRFFAFIGFYLGINLVVFAQQQCDIVVSAHPDEIYCGQEVVLTAYGKSGTYLLNENFNTGGFGPGWGGTPGGVSFSNPCSPGGVDGTPHAWMDSNTDVPRMLTSATYDISMANAGVTICFDLLYATQGGTAPCEGPDLANEGVYLQYSVNGGTNWQTIHYFDPNGGYNPQLTNWNNYCFQIPAAAITTNTMFRWFQDVGSGAPYDHWGIDNIQIVINDEGAEITWLHDGYSYGLGNAGGNNPNPVTPTTNTTYTAQLLTGFGQTCTASVSVVVKEPIYRVDVDVNPDPVCEGDCGDLTGTAVQIIHPGGITKYENNLEVSVSSGGLGTITGSVDLNVQGINAPSLTPGMITEVCINDFKYFAINFFPPSSITASNFEYKLVGPGGCEITLIPSGALQPSTEFGPGLQNVCFVTGGATNIGSVSEPYSGTYAPHEPFDNLAGCDPNGVWTIEITAPAIFSAPFTGRFKGWSITFDNPPVIVPANVAWDPAANMANPNQIDNQVCPPNIGANTYSLTVSNGVAGCATGTETITVMVDPCNGCDIPQVVTNPLVECVPNTVNLENAIDPSSEAATLSYHNTQADAQNDVNAISNTTVSTSGTYWVRIENPAADTCFTTQQITVTISSGADASFTLTDFCPGGTTNPVTNIATPGGTFAFNPVPSDGATINPTTGAISGGVSGATYSVEYTVGGASCPGSSIETVQVFTNPTPVILGSLTYCPGNPTVLYLDSASAYVSYSWTDAANIPLGASQTYTTTAINGIKVTVTDVNGCSGTSIPVNVVESSLTITPVSISICPGETIIVHGHPVSTAGIYVDTFPTSGGCDSLSRVTVTVHTVVQPVISGNLWYCEGGTASLSTTPGNYTSYSWSTGDTQPAINTTTDQSITVTATDANGCSSTSDPVVLVHPPQAVLSANPTSGIVPLTVDFTNNSTGAITYDWFIESIDTFSTVNMDNYTYVYGSEGTYAVILVAHSANCSDTAIVHIVVEVPLGAHIPNVFTPNGDGINDFFTFDTSNATDLKVTIVNRWGNLVYESTDVNFLWDGRDMSGNPVTEGVYFFDYRITGLSGEELSGHGFVTVER